MAPLLLVVGELGPRLWADAFSRLGCRTPQALASELATVGSLSAHLSSSSVAGYSGMPVTSSYFSVSAQTQWSLTTLGRAAARFDERRFEKKPGRGHIMRCVPEHFKCNRNFARNYFEDVAAGVFVVAASFDLGAGAPAASSFFFFFFFSQSESWWHLISSRRGYSFDCEHRRRRTGGGLVETTPSVGGSSSRRDLCAGRHLSAGLGGGRATGAAKRKE